MANFGRSEAELRHWRQVSLQVRDDATSAIDLTYLIELNLFVFSE